jgi:hypothetical protein
MYVACRLCPPRGCADARFVVIAVRLPADPGAQPEAIPRLVEAGVLQQTTIGRRNRAFEAPALIDAFNDLERQSASPDGDTLHSPRARRVPRRRR